MTAATFPDDPMHADARRVGILLTNNDVSDFSDRFPNDGEMVRTWLRTQRPDWHYDIFSVKDDVFPAITASDCYVITGRPASVNDSLPWIRRLETLIQTFHKVKIPLIGLCFGHQIIAKALGGTVTSNPGGWRFGAAETRFESLASWMRPDNSRLNLHASHSEQVTRLPDGARALGGDHFCPIASYAIGTHIFTTQYHPEFSRDFMVALADAYEGEVPKNVLDQGRHELHNTVHADGFTRWAANFLSEAPTTASSLGRPTAFESYA